MVWVLELVHAVDQLFSRVVQIFNHRDVFATQELTGVAQTYASVEIDSGDIVSCGVRHLTNIRIAMPSNRSLHDFVFAKGASYIPFFVKNLLNTSTTTYGIKISNLKVYIIIPKVSFFS